MQLDHFRNYQRNLQKAVQISLGSTTSRVDGNQVRVITKQAQNGLRHALFGH